MTRLPSTQLPDFTEDLGGRKKELLFPQRTHMFGGGRSVPLNPELFVFTLKNM